MGRSIQHVRSLRQLAYGTLKSWQPVSHSRQSMIPESDRPLTLPSRFCSGRRSHSLPGRLDTPLAACRCRSDPEPACSLRRVEEAKGCQEVGERLLPVTDGAAILVVAGWELEAGCVALAGEG